jgi:hypothetical protein
MVKRVKDTKGLKFYCDVIIYRYLIITHIRNKKGATATLRCAPFSKKDSLREPLLQIYNTSISCQNKKQNTLIF